MMWHDKRHQPNDEQNVWGRRGSESKWFDLTKREQMTQHTLLSSKETGVEWNGVLNLTTIIPLASSWFSLVHVVYVIRGARFRLEGRILLSYRQLTVPIIRKQSPEGTAKHINQHQHFRRRSEYQSNTSVMSSQNDFVEDLIGVSLCF